MLSQRSASLGAAGLCPATPVNPQPALGTPLLCPFGPIVINGKGELLNSLASFKNKQRAESALPSACPAEGPENAEVVTVTLLPMSSCTTSTETSIKFLLDGPKLLGFN